VLTSVAPSHSAHFPLHGDPPDFVDTWTASPVERFSDLNALNYGLEQEDIQLLGWTTKHTLKEHTRESQSLVSNTFLLSMHLHIC